MHGAAQCRYLPDRLTANGAEKGLGLRIPKHSEWGGPPSTAGFSCKSRQLGDVAGDAPCLVQREHMRNIGVQRGFLDRRHTRALGRSYGLNRRSVGLQEKQLRGRYRQGSSIVPLYLPPSSVSVSSSLVYVPPPLAPSYLPVPPVHLYVYSLRCEPSSQVSVSLSPPLTV